MTSWQCASCRAQVAPGAPRCPECPSTSFIKPEPEADMLKINRDGHVSDSADVRAAEAAENAEVAGIEARLEAEPLQAEDAAAEAQSPAPAPAAPSRPPRRTPPPAVPRE